MTSSTRGVFQQGAVLLAVLLPVVLGHGRLLEPPSRASMWRFDFDNPRNYDDNQLYCGGVQVQWTQNGGKCGVCGDPWQGPREHEAGGKYANGIIVRKYNPGDMMDVTVELTANHKGWFEFRLCPNDDPNNRITLQCLDRYLLKVAGSDTTRYQTLLESGYSKTELKLVLPPNVRCRDCVLQWKYNSGNTWGTDPVTGEGCLGCGPQEQFYACADIAIGYPDIKVGSKLNGNWNGTTTEGNNNGIPSSSHSVRSSMVFLHFAILISCMTKSGNMLVI